MRRRGSNRSVAPARSLPAWVELSVLAAGLLGAAVSGTIAYRMVGPYGDGPFGAGYRRQGDPGGGSTLVHEARHGAQMVRTVVDERTRRASAVLVDADADGAFEARAAVETGGGVRVERDLDGDGVPDRWDYYRDPGDAARGRLARVGFSLGGDAVVDAWAFYGIDGRLTRVEVSTARDGVVDRWEHYADGRLVRVETDTDGDGRVDAWSTYESGILWGTLRDADGDGRPDGDGAATFPVEDGPPAGGRGGGSR